MTIPFGKYKGKSIQWVYDNDRSYYKWLEGIQLKEPFATKFADFHNSLLQKEREIENGHVYNVLGLIEEFIKDNDEIYGVNVHSVGFEFRFNGISLEEIMNERFSLRYYDNNGVVNVELSKENYDVLYEVMYKYWTEKGKPWQDRGLY